MDWLDVAEQSLFDRGDTFSGRSHLELFDHGDTFNGRSHSESASPYM